MRTFFRSLVSETETCVVAPPTCSSHTPSLPATSLLTRVRGFFAPCSISRTAPLYTCAPISACRRYLWLPRSESVPLITSVLVAGALILGSCGPARPRVSDMILELSSGLVGPVSAPRSGHRGAPCASLRRSAPFSRGELSRVPLYIAVLSPAPRGYVCVHFVKPFRCRHYCFRLSLSRGSVT